MQNYSHSNFGGIAPFQYPAAEDEYHQTLRPELWQRITDYLDSFRYRYDFSRGAPAMREERLGEISESFNELRFKVRESYEKSIFNPEYFKQNRIESFLRIGAISFVAFWAYLNDDFPIDIQDQIYFSVLSQNIGVGDILVNLIALGGIYGAGNNANISLAEILVSGGGLCADNATPFLSFACAGAMAFYYGRNLNNNDLNIYEDMASFAGSIMAGAGGARFARGVIEPLANILGKCLAYCEFEVNNVVNEIQQNRQVNTGNNDQTFTAMINCFWRLFRSRDEARVHIEGDEQNAQPSQSTSVTDVEEGLGGRATQQYRANIP